MFMDIKCGYLLNNRLIEIPAESIKLDYFDKLKKVLTIKKVENYPLVRIGTKDKDGGYVMVDNFDKGSIAYSFGICDDVNWDNHLADRGYEIFMYDHTIEKLPFERKEFHFFKEGISGICENNGLLNTLEHYIEKNGHKNCQNMILKMDVEGYEWGFLNTVNTDVLKQFDQIVFEFHRLLNPDGNETAIKLIEKLNQTHQLIHIHGNNCSMAMQIGEQIFADTIEATYVNKENYKIVDEVVYLPTELDRPNDPAIDDLILGKWNL